MFKTTMHAHHPAIFALVFALIGATISATALAEPRRGDKRAVRDVVGEVEHNYRGHVVDVQPPRANEETYRVRVLQEGGRVKTLRVPAKREQDRRRER